MEKKRWEAEYPKMPESFHLAVLGTVEQKIGEETENEGTVVKKNLRPKQTKKIKGKKILFWGMAAVLIWGGLTAAAGRRIDFREYLGVEKQQNIEKAFQSEIEVRVEEEPRLPELVEKMEEEEKKEYIDWVESRKKRKNNKQLLDIREVMFDGLRLSIYGVPTKEGKKYRLGGTDRLYINGKQTVPDTWVQEGVCIFTVDVGNLDLQTPFEVTLPVSVSGRGDQRYENQDLTFTVDTDAAAVKLPDQKFETADYTVEVTELRKSLFSVQGKASVVMTEQQKAAYEKGEWMFTPPSFQDGEGRELSVFLEISQGDVHKEDEPIALQWYFHRKLPEGETDHIMLQLRGAWKSSGEKGTAESKLLHSFVLTL